MGERNDGGWESDGDNFKEIPREILIILDEGSGGEEHSTGAGSRELPAEGCVGSTHGERHGGGALASP